MVYTCLAATLMVALMTALPYSRSEAWWVRMFDFPRLQIATVAIVMLLVEMTVLDLADIASWFLLAVGMLCLMAQLWWIVPYTALSSIEVRATAGEVDSDNSLRVMSSNVLGPNRCSDKLLDLVREHAPDVLVTLESNAWWEKQLEVLETDYPYTVKCPLENLFGMHVYSRLALSNSSVEYLVEDHIPSIHTCVKLPSGVLVTAHFLHPTPPNPEFNDESSERDAELVIVARKVADNDKPTIVCGDLNDVAWSSTTRLFRKLSGLLDPRIGRGMFNTYNAKWWFMRWPLDHLFHSRHFLLRELQRLPEIGSDHFPLLTTLVFDPSAIPASDAPGADADDEARARDKSDDEGVGANDVPDPG
ncbi:MAG: endonuclease/exonuclease/phosphatase family protein [Dokdonella sp.]